MRRALKFLAQGILSYVVTAAFIAVVEYISWTDCPDCDGGGRAAYDTGGPRICWSCGRWL